MAASATYRNDIDGLRAFAVVAVVLYHVFPRWLPGGFAGVDVFFVISGFLITGQFTRRRLGFASFYARRVRRLVPSLLCVLLATVLAGSFILLPKELSALGLDCFAGATFLSNFFSWQAQGYFDRSASLKPLLHLWSLGVEEQFYLLWPALLVMAQRVSLSLPRLVSVTFGASFVFGLFCAFHSPETDFYWPLARIWEFMLGATLIASADGFSRLHSGGRNLCSLSGLACLLIAAFELSPDWFFPTPTALLPAVGTNLLIAAGPETWIARRILSFRPLRLLGLISYPLYLWHWPLIAYEHIVHGVSHVHRSTGYAIIALSVLLAALTYRFVEMPLRWKTPARPTIIALLASLLLTALLGLALWSHPDIIARQNANDTGINLAKINLAEQDGIFPITPHMHVAHEQRITVATIGPAIGDPILFTGDSLLFQWGPHVDALFAQGRLKHTVIFISGPNCAPVPVEHYTKNFTYCDAMPAVQDHVLNRHPVQTIVMGAYWQRVFGLDPTLWPDKKTIAEKRLKTLSANGTRRLVFILPTPISSHFDPAQMVQRHFTKLTIDSAFLHAGIPIQSIRADNVSLTTFLTGIARDVQATPLDLTDSICGSAKTCFPLMADGTPKFADEKHLRPDFTRGPLPELDRLLTQ